MKASFTLHAPILLKNRRPDEIAMKTKILEGIDFASETLASEKSYRLFFGTKAQRAKARDAIVRYHGLSGERFGTLSYTGPIYGEDGVRKFKAYQRACKHWFYGESDLVREEHISMAWAYCCQSYPETVVTFIRGAAPLLIADRITEVLGSPAGSLDRLPERPWNHGLFRATGSTENGQSTYLGLCELRDRPFFQAHMIEVAEGIGMGSPTRTLLASGFHMHFDSNEQPIMMLRGRKTPTWHNYLVGTHCTRKGVSMILYSTQISTRGRNTSLHKMRFDRVSNDSSIFLDSFKW